MPEIRIGTSDYSFQDWKGPFYPEIVKVHKQVTHQRTNIEISMENLFTSLEPIAQSGRLKVFLTQFPYSFKHSEQSRKHLIHLHELCADWPFSLNSIRRAGYSLALFTIH